MSELNFSIKKYAGKARLGSLDVNNWHVNTPVIVHTGNELGKLTATELAATGAQAVKVGGLKWWLDNPDNLDEAFPLHDLFQWNGLLLVNQQTADAYRLAKPRGRKKDGVRFHDPKTGQMKFYRPADGLAVQQAFGADIYLTFARLGDYYAPVDDVDAGVDQTISWLPAFSTVKAQTLGIVTGGGLKRSREKSIQALADAGFAGYALGEIPTNLSEQEFARIVSETVGKLPQKGLRYLASSASLVKICLAVQAGIDLIDSDLAAKKAGVGVALVGNRLDTLHIDRQHFAVDSHVLDVHCECPVCQAGYSRAAIHHMLVTNSLLGEQMLLQHNLFKVNQMMRLMRQVIEEDNLENFIQELLHNA